MRRLLMAAGLLLALAIAFAGCSGEDDPTASRRFDLFIENDTDEVYEVHRATNIGTGGTFNQVGGVSPRSVRTVNGLVVGLEYTFRLVPVGGDVDSPAHELVVQSSGEDETWRVN